MTELVRITPEEKQAIRQPAAALLAGAREFKIANADHYVNAGAQLKVIKGRQKELEERKQRLLKPLRAAVKEVNELFAAPERELDEAESLYKRSLIAYDEEQERIRAEEQRRRDEEANRERQRLQREADERERAAAASREAGRTTVAARQEAKAEELRQAADQTVPAVVQKEQPKVAGLARRENWYAVVTDFKALVAAVAAGTVPITALQANMPFLNNQAKAMKKELAYPGVSPAMDKVLASGSK